MTRFYKGKKSQEKYFTENSECKFFVAQDFAYGVKSSKQYGAFKTIEDFFEFEKSLNEKCCYETLRGGKNS